jgi:hypothetical protein
MQFYQRLFAIRCGLNNLHVDFIAIALARRALMIVQTFNI